MKRTPGDDVHLSVVDRHRRRDHICWTADQISKSAVLKAGEGDDLEKQADPIPISGERRIWAGSPRARPFGPASPPTIVTQGANPENRGRRAQQILLADRACAAAPASSRTAASEPRRQGLVIAWPPSLRLGQRYLKSKPSIVKFLLVVVAWCRQSLGRLELFRQVTCGRMTILCVILTSF